MSGRGWVCEAYGPDLPEGCFFDLVEPCASAAVCSSRLVRERGRVFGRIQEMAAGGDQVAKDLAGAFRGPEDLLGGPGAAMDAGEVASVLRQPVALVKMWEQMGIAFRRAVRDGQPVVESYDDELDGGTVVTGWFPLDEQGEWTGVQIVDPPMRKPPPLGLEAEQNVVTGQDGLAAGVRELVDLEVGGARLPVEMGPHSAFLLVSAVQFAMRHPEFPLRLGTQLRVMCDQIQGALVAACGSPVAKAAAEGLTLGWDPRFDVPQDGDGGQER